MDEAMKALQELVSRGYSFRIQYQPYAGMDFVRIWSNHIHVKGGWAIDVESGINCTDNIKLLEKAILSAVDKVKEAEEKLKIA